MMRVLFFAVLLSSVMHFGWANAQTIPWYPPEEGPEVQDVAPPLNTGTSSQIKSGAVGIDLRTTSLTLPLGTGLLARAGSVFIELIGGSVLSGWIPSSFYAIDTNAPIRGHGLSSTSDITSFGFRTYSATESKLCVNVETGVLKKCSLPTVTLTASPGVISSSGNTLSWTSINTTNCVGSGFDTGNAVSGSVVVNPVSSTTYTIDCAGPGGNTVRSVVVSLPNPTITSLTATPNPFAMSNGYSLIKYTTTNATNCWCRIYANQGAGTWMSTCGTNLPPSGEFYVSNSHFSGASREVGLECVNGNNPLKAFRRVWVTMY
jgi:hypothetical protein